MRSNNELLYFNVLTRIAKFYMPAEKLLRNGEKLYGVSGEEAVQMAYENIQEEARAAIKGKRRPRE